MMMSYKIGLLYASTLILVFFFGFFSGIRYEQIRPGELPDSGRTPTIETKFETNLDPDEISEEEKKILKALEDPEFRKIHDLLNRENPMQMDLTLPEPVAEEEKTPISERPPIQFSLPPEP